MQYHVEEFQPRALNGYQSETSSHPQSNSPLQEYIDRQSDSKPGEIARLIKQIQAGNLDAGPDLIDESLKVIRYSVRRLNKAIQGDEDELINIACEGILNTIHSVDLATVSPVAAIYGHTRWSILSSKAILPRNISLPVSTMPEFRAMHMAESSLEANGIYPDDEEFLDLLAQKIDELKPVPSIRSDRPNLIKNGRAMVNAVPMERKMGQTFESHILPHELSDPNQLLDEVESAVSADMSFRLMATAARLQIGATKWERRYTVAEFRAADFTLQALANAMGVTRERIRQLESDFYRVMAQHMYTNNRYPDHLVFSESSEEAMERRRRVFAKVVETK